MKRYILTSLGLGLLTACGVELDSLSDTNEALSLRESIVDRYNQPMRGTLLTEVVLAPGSALRDSEGRSLGFAACADGGGDCKVQVQRMERVPALSTQLYWLRAAGTDGKVRSGQVAEGSIKGRPPETELRLANGNGSAAALAEEIVVRPRPLSIELGYQGQDAALRDECFSYRPYGTPGDIYDRPPQDPSYTMLVWSLPSVSEGGLNRRVLRAGDRVRRTTVPDVTLRTYPNSSKERCGQSPNGWVKWMYVMAKQNGQAVYGWMVKESQRGADPVQAHWASVPVSPPPGPPSPPAEMPTSPVGTQPTPPQVETCFVRCCDNHLAPIPTTSDAECREQYPVCIQRSTRTRRMERGGREVYSRPGGC